MTRTLPSIALLAALVLAPATGARPAFAEPPAGPAAAGLRKEPPLLLAIFSAGPLLGLEAPLRGLSATAGLRAAWGGFAPGLRLGLRWDGALAAPIAEAQLLLALGPELALFAGADLPLATLRPFEGDERALEAAELPSRVGLSARLLGLSRPERGEEGLDLEAELAFSRLRPKPGAGEGADLAAYLAGPGGFSLGLTAALRLRLSLGLGRRRQ